MSPDKLYEMCRYHPPFTNLKPNGELRFSLQNHTPLIESRFAGASEHSFPLDHIRAIAVARKKLELLATARPVVALPIPSPDASAMNMTTFPFAGPREEFGWTCGNDLRLKHIKKLNVGAYSEVHQVCRLSSPDYLPVLDQNCPPSRSARRNAKCSYSNNRYRFCHRKKTVEAIFYAFRE